MRTTSLPRLSAAFILVLLGGICAAAALNLARAPRASLGLEERVAYQRRIEEVYWRHRTATQVAGQPPVAFAEAAPEAAIRAKVDETIQKSSALAEYWQRPITSAQLQAEVERMAAQTRQPEMLRELWKALDNDPYVIAECLARPSLVEREMSAWYAHDERFHGALRARVEAELRANSGAPLKNLTGEYSERQFIKQGTAAQASKSQLGIQGAEEKAAKLRDGEWENLLARLQGAFADGTDASDPLRGSQPILVDVPVARVSSLQENETQFYVVSVLEQSANQLTLATVSWPKTPLDVWWSTARNDLPLIAPDSASAQNYELPALATPSVANDDSWKPTTAALSARENHTAIWTGSEMIVWGGFYNPSNFTDYSVTVGGRYNPATDSWTLTSTVNAPVWRERHTAVWTGTEMIVWGGNVGGAAQGNTGARYNPATNVWTPTSLTNAPAARSRHTAVWTGSRMLVWGGRTGDTDDTTVNTGGAYDPASNTWTAMTTSNAPAGRMYHTAVWSGTEMIVWGGYNGASEAAVNTGGRYNPQSNSWQPTNTAGALPARYAQNAVWTGTRMFIWGGAGPNFFSQTFYNTGALYDPTANTWTASSTTNAPAPRNAAMAVWSGSEVLIWGGFDGSQRLRTGGRYNPQSNTWQTLGTAGAPASSVAASAVWTGSEMIVWGGQEPTLASDVNTGARYNPQTDSWVPATNPQNGGARTEHPAVWTGTEMIVWGSYAAGSAPTNTGARYYPSTDTWLATSMANVPNYRYSPAAVWTGSEMVVWGGCSDSFCFNRLNTGGRYNPATDSWRATTTLGAAEARYWFSMVWSGTEAIVWGGCDASVCGPGGNSDPVGLNNGGRYNPQTDTWQLLNTAGAPTGRWFHAAEWSGSELIVWGGLNGSGPFNTGGRYNLTSGTWTPTSTTNAPVARGYVHSVWTGARMIVWGGNNSLLDQDMNSGGLYDPASDSWTATSLTNAPSPRLGHTLVWTGSEMIAWGGCSGPNCQTGTNTGGRYNPQTNAWRTMSTVEAPSPRDVHSAVWTGSEMIVFGGESCARCEPVLDTGGRYLVASAPVATGAVSRKSHGTAGNFDIALPLSGNSAVEPRSGGATGDYQLVVTFNTSVTVNGTPQAQVTSGVGQVGSSGSNNGGNVSVSGSTVTVPLTNVANAQTITVTLFAVNNATDVALSMGVLLGDTNGDGVVNSGDALQTRNRSGAAADSTNFRCDVNNDGAVNSGDATIVRARSGDFLP